MNGMDVKKVYYEEVIRIGVEGRGTFSFSSSRSFEAGTGDPTVVLSVVGGENTLSKGIVVLGGSFKVESIEL